MARLKCEVCIIGAGSAGLSVAAGLSQLGLRTVLIEHAEMGGECLNTGCVPSKALLAAAKAASHREAAEIPGVSGAPAGVDFAAVKGGVLDVIAAIAPKDSRASLRRAGRHGPEARGHVHRQPCGSRRRRYRAGRQVRGRHRL